ncbi:MAG TPA: hypothetical protein VIU41_02400 [Geobacteraceae bacterium]
MRYMIIACLGGTLLVAAGCSSNKNFVLLRHPVTNNVVECPGETGIYTGTAAEIKACVKAYKDAGYEEVGSY